ncbi:ArnT family glycosyltransferase [Thiosocius teredinicola]|uniref:ArnT family glycosyltransferase n=1 Tax=Thiosocius teredinicola TaxID=1973002 RepID=UPI0009910E8D
MFKRDPAALHWSLAQIIVLAVISAALVAMAPETWRYHPDGAVYIASAVTMAEEGRYWFNGHPNILYYPGLSMLLYLPIKIWGLNFQVLHLVAAALGVTTLWIIRGYFNAGRFGWTGLLLPLLMAANALIMQQTTLVMSGVPFLGVSIAALWVWRRFLTEDNYWLVFACALLVGFASLVRFQGLFLIGAFGLALIVHFVRNRDRNFKAFFLLAMAGIVSVVPFVIWTARNYALYTPDTYNMAGEFFFGQEGLSISEADWGEADWIDAAWKYPVYQAMTLFGSLAKSFLNDVQHWFPLEVKSALALGLMTLGFWPWLRRASVMEAAYVIVSLAFLMKDSLEGTSLYFPQRYWIPMVPFAAVMAGLGLAWLYELSTKVWMKATIAVGSGIAVALMLASGVLSWSDDISRENTERWATRMASIDRTAQQIRETTAPDSILLSTDWGIMPLLTNRQSFQVSRSKCSGPTLSLIAERHPDYLVEMPGLLRTRIVERLVDDYPELFELQFEAGTRESRDRAALYRINHDQLPAALDNIDCLPEPAEETE